MSTEIESEVEEVVDTTAPVADTPAPSDDGLFNHEYDGPDDDDEPVVSDHDEVDTDIADDAKSVSAKPADDLSSKPEDGPTLRELAEALGEDPEDFESEAELLRFAKLKDKLMRQVQPASEKQEPETKVPAAKPEPEAVVQELQAEGLFDLKKLREEGYGEFELKLAELLPTLTSKIKSLEAKLSEKPTGELERRMAVLDQWEAEQRLNSDRKYFETFHTVVDKWGDEKFGRVLDDDGRPSDLAPDKQAEREKLFNEMRVISEVESKYGRDLTMTQLLTKARLNLYPNDFKRQLRKEVEDKGKARGKKRLGSPTNSRTNSQSQAEPLSEYERKRQAAIDYINEQTAN